jgi:hypothetical protein
VRSQTLLTECYDRTDTGEITNRRASTCTQSHAADRTTLRQNRQGRNYKQESQYLFVRSQTLLSEQRYDRIDTAETTNREPVLTCTQSNAADRTTLRQNRHGRNYKQESQYLLVRSQTLLTEQRYDRIDTGETTNRRASTYLYTVKRC